MKSSLVASDRVTEHTLHAGAVTSRRDASFAVGITVLFLVFGGLTIWHHEMWRDELQAWMISSSSHSISDLLHNLRYDGHPALWYLLLYGISRVTSQPQFMQALHILLAAGAVYVFVRFAPFSRFQKTLFAFGYFPLYEYGVISRNYAVGILLTFLVCALYPRRGTRLLGIAVLLGLLANASAYGCMIAISLGLSLCGARLMDRQSGRRWSVPQWGVFASAVIIAVGIMFAAKVMKPAPDSGMYAAWFLGFSRSRLIDALSTVGASHILLPNIFTQWSMEQPGSHIRMLQAALGVLLMGYSVLTFARKPVVLLLYVSSLALFLGLMYSKHPGTVRHHGHIFIMFMVCMWLSSGYRDRALGWRLADRVSAACARLSPAVLTALLLIHFGGGVAACVRDIQRPFSEAKDVAQFVRTNHLGNLPVIGDRDTPASAVAGYLGRPIWYAADGKVGTYIVFDQSRKRKLASDELIRDARQSLVKDRAGALLVLDYKLDESVCTRMGARPLRTFTGSTVPSEDYWLYLVHEDSGR